MAKSKNGGKNPQKKIVTVNLGLSWLYILIISGIIWMLFSNSGPNPQKTEWADVKEMIEAGDVKDIVFVRNDFKGEITIRPDRLSKYSERFGGNFNQCMHRANELAIAGELSEEYFRSILFPETRKAVKAIMAVKDELDAIHDKQEET